MLSQARETVESDRYNDLARTDQVALEFVGVGDVEQCVCTVTLDSTRYLERKWSREQVKLSRAESKEGRKEAKSVV